MSTMSFIPSSISEESKSRVSILDLSKAYLQKLNDLCQLQTYLASVFQKGKACKNRMIALAKAGDGTCDFNGLKILMVDCENAKSTDLTYNRLVACLAYSCISKKKYHEEILRSLGAGLTLEHADIEKNKIFQCCLVSGAGFLPNCFLSSRGGSAYNDQGHIAIAAAIALDWKRSGGTEGSLSDFFENADSSDDTSALNQMSRQGVFEKMKDIDYSIVKAYTELISYNSNTGLKKR